MRLPLSVIAFDELNLGRERKRLDKLLINVLMEGAALCEIRLLKFANFRPYLKSILYVIMLFRLYIVLTEYLYANVS